MALILASASPRRKELLGYITQSFTVKVSDAEEVCNPSLSPEETAKELARIKGMTVSRLCPDDTVISADTIVVLDNDILGKPRSREQAYSMLRSLSGRTHLVYTGVFIKTENKEISFAEKTEVSFCPLTDEEIYSYIDSGEPFDKAGGYGIQGKGSLMICSINGDYYNVMGLPVSRLYTYMKENGII